MFVECLGSRIECFLVWIARGLVPGASAGPWFQEIGLIVWVVVLIEDGIAAFRASGCVISEVYHLVTSLK